ncbi:MAG TPA: lysylphosphatidylglycerol synthase transmembrane domain-containing protein, partial [Chitinophagaceae bacterium]|nr:lysylphosphatidylglycerol synthase transmembrane domain-containing protein [Chitinophagaceae bacterium]
MLKIVVSGLCIWYVSGKIDFRKAGEALQKANVFYLVLALLTFVVSKIIASFRLNIYFKNIFIRLSEWTNLKLYWLGMFYNLFLPGSIGGDAYKVLLLKKKFNAP